MTAASDPADTPSSANTRTIRVSVPSRAYDVCIGSGVLFGRGDAIGRAVAGAKKVHIFQDEGLIAGFALAAITASCQRAGIEAVSVSTIKPSEADKSLQTLNRMLLALAEHRLDRADAVIALGGGIVGDMAGFAAASYRRGLRWINCPTTLLSMVDASVGGKTGVNLRVGADLQKNMVGAFWQPSLVIADVDTLSTLPAREFRSGLAECVKHGLLSADFGDPHLLHWIRGNLAHIQNQQPDALVELIARNVAVKAAVVGTDEREEAPSSAGGRALLNFGHTFGHAIETIPQVSPTASKSDAPLHHGEAVALGLICAARAAELLKLVAVGLADDVRRTLGHIGLPTVAHNLPPAAEVFRRMADDKKVTGGKPRLIVPCGEGHCRVIADPPSDVVIQAIEAILPARP